MDKQTTSPSPAPPWLAYLAQGGTMKELRNIDQSQLDAIYQVAYGRFNSGLFNESLILFRHLCLLDHTHYGYFLGLGMVQFELQQFAQAAATLSHAEKLDAEDPRASVMMAKCFIELKKRPLVANALSEAISRAGRSERWHKELEQARRLMNYVGEHSGRK
ncbi:hypothetical protein [Endozoicomonas sp.]|uniref:hypothetical protein n=1 Tax=Endozoicomonas sp. TaxID=1892382 RepID=UPI0028874389|nr:hypothetical protein [Endozoicomonas sp.]